MDVGIWRRERLWRLFGIFTVPPREERIDEVGHLLGPRELDSFCLPLALDLVTEVVRKPSAAVVSLGATYASISGTGAT